MKRVFCNLFVILLTITTGAIFNIGTVDAHDATYTHGHTSTGEICGTDWWNPCPADAFPTLTSEEKARIVSLVTLDAVIFNELFNASNDAHDWVELRNVTNTDVDLSGWSLIVTSSEEGKSIAFPAGTVLPAGELLLFVNTDPSEPNMPLSTSEDTSYQYLVDAAFTLPQVDFLLLLRSPTAWEDSAGSFLFGHEESTTTVDFTLNTAWSRAKASVLGNQTEAWVVSGYQGGLGYDENTPEASGLGTPGHPHEMLLGDVNGDGVVNILDLVLVASQFGQSGETTVDLNNDGVVSIQDLVLVANSISGAAGAPSARSLTAGQVQEWLRLAKDGATLPIQTLITQPDFSYERGIQVLEQLLQMLIPKETTLLANYPNPFNPETWIPYQLATASDVQIAIYDTRGILVRQFNLGHQPAGLYQSRSRAAYWDGTNELGESVASGIYFYTLTAADFSATRKMLILK